MSKRRSAGEIVWKKDNAGFVGVGSLCQIQPDDDSLPCVLCKDPDCREWATLWACDESGNPTGGIACHVSECEMLDAAEKAGAGNV